MKWKRIGLGIAAVILLVLAAGLVSRSHATRVADSAMQKFLVRGWHIDRIRFLPAINGPFWLVTYEHDDYPSCFPPQVVVGITGKIFNAPCLGEIEKTMAAVRKETRSAEPPVRGDGKPAPQP